MTRARKKWTKREKKLTNPLIWKHNLVPQVIIILFSICMLFASFSTQYLHFIFAKNISIWYSFPQYNRFIADAIDSQANKNLLQKHLWVFFYSKNERTFGTYICCWCESLHVALHSISSWIFTYRTKINFPDSTAIWTLL